MGDLKGYSENGYYNVYRVSGISKGDVVALKDLGFCAIPGCGLESVDGL